MGVSGIICAGGREPTACCHQCGASQDSAQHTLAECPTFAEERRALTTKFGNDLSLEALIPKVLEGKEDWEIFTSFCDIVLSQKEEEERVRRGEVAPLDSLGDGGGVPPRLRRRTKPLAHLRPR
ncbi:uncharacterized protein [Cardiocondyla obscurior]|uniref:uncharacterized protein n=1 Tax=Cardiocondyla obscurior TaxID=286306 RepID=UPI0039656E7C